LLRRILRRRTLRPRRRDAQKQNQREKRGRRRLPALSLLVSKFLPAHRKCRLIAKRTHCGEIRNLQGKYNASQLTRKPTRRQFAPRRAA
jgi:hypothetical protein